MLKLRGNSIQDPEVHALFRAIATSSELEELDLGMNQVCLMHLSAMSVSAYHHHAQRCLSRDGMHAALLVILTSLALPVQHHYEHALDVLAAVLMMASPAVMVALPSCTFICMHPFRCINLRSNDFRSSC